MTTLTGPAEVSTPSKDGFGKVADALGTRVGGTIMSLGREVGLAVGTTATDISHARDTAMKRERNKTAFFIVTSAFKLHHSH